jgi:rhamnulokinase
VAVGSHDTASAYAAAPVSGPGSLIISSGTWSLIGTLVRHPVTTPEAMRLNVSNEGGIGNVRLLKNCMGTWLAQSLRRQWRDRDGKEMDWTEMGSLADQGKRFAAFIDPDDKGFYNPPDMEQAIVGYCRSTGQEPPSDRATLLRSVYESLALKYRVVAEEIGTVSGEQMRSVHIVGGGSRNTTLNQMAADACGLGVLAGPEEATAIGNAAVQGTALGVWPRLSEARKIIRSSFPMREFRPLDRERWEQALARFRAATG